GYFGTSWLRPATEAEALWEIAFREGQRTGDLFHTGCAVSGTVQSLIMRGVPLNEVARRIDAFWPVVEQAHLREPKTLLSSARRVIARLRSQDEATTVEDAQLQTEVSSFGARHFAHFHFLNQCMLHALTGNTTAGSQSAQRSATYLSDSKGLLNTPEHYFWAAMLDAATPSRRKYAARSVTAARKKFSAWSAQCPANFALRCRILSAEEARLAGKHNVAANLYNDAIQLGREQQVLHLLGLANRRAASLAATVGHAAEAAAFDDAADAAFLQWGAPVLSRSHTVDHRQLSTISQGQGAIE
ncbi:MAG TPA: hypothetical protein VN151_07520, partial [Terracidiphilus sp.]|nr:hypothetical protein [Terracidiphilus sp.]